MTKLTVTCRPPFSKKGEKTGKSGRNEVVRALLYLVGVGYGPVGSEEGAKALVVGDSGKSGGVGGDRDGGVFGNNSDS